MSLLDRVRVWLGPGTQQEQEERERKTEEAHAKASGVRSRIDRLAAEQDDVDRTIRGRQ